MIIGAVIMTFYIRGTGMYVPDRVVTNDEIDVYKRHIYGRGAAMLRQRCYRFFCAKKNRQQCFCAFLGFTPF